MEWSSRVVRCSSCGVFCVADIRRKTFARHACVETAWLRTRGGRLGNLRLAESCIRGEAKEPPAGWTELASLQPVSATA